MGVVFEEQRFFFCSSNTTFLNKSYGIINSYSVQGGMQNEKQKISYGYNYGCYLKHMRNFL